MDKNNVIAFIPARGGSKSIPKKNIKILGGKPLIAWTIEKALDCHLRTIVNTDDEEIAEIARKYGAEIMMRPKGLAQDNISLYEVLKNEVPKIKSPEFVLLLQPTSPFRKKIHIKMAIDYFMANLDKFDSLVSVERVPEKYNPYQVFIVTSAGAKTIVGKIMSLREKIKSFFTGIKYKQPSLSGYPLSRRLTRRQDAPEAFATTGSIYLFKSSNLKEGSIYGKKTMLLETDPEVNINSIKDWKEAERFITENKI